MPSRLFVAAKEWSLIVSRQVLKPGPARIQLYNAGQDAHDLRIQRVGGSRSLAFAVTSPGHMTEVQGVLRSGTWRLWCSLPEHAKRGMRATLVVKR